MENPFDNPTTLRDPERFIGRKEQLARIFGLIKNRQNVSLVGPRRIGKTSLLNCLRDETIQGRFHFDGSKFLFIYLDLQQFAMKTRDFFDDINLALKQKSLEYREEEVEKDDEFITLLRRFQQRGLHPVLIIDAFDKVTQYEQLDINVFSFLRAYGNSGQITYITASVQPLGDIFHRLATTRLIVSPFPNIFSVIRLSPFSPSEAQNLLTHFSRSEGLPFTNQEAEWILDMAGYHPYLLQQVAALLFEKKRARDSNEDDLQRLRKEAQQNLQSHFEACWNALNDDERLSLLHFASHWNTLSKNERLSLIDETLENGRREIDFPELSFSALFQDHLRRTEYLENLEARPLVSLDDFKKILNAFNDQRALGESVLIRVPYIAKQIKQQGAISPILKGKIVQVALKEALESMRGQEKRSDVARDWAYYNALYYRYFARQKIMTQEAIAYRLGMSTRHYYRLLSEAADRLWHTLLEMEEDSKSGSSV